MTLVTDSIAAQIATLTRIVDAPVELGYGRDLRCVTDITEHLEEVDPNSTLGIAEAALRRLTTPRGGVADDLNYGLDVRGYANRGTTVAEIRDLSGQIRAELRKDDRIEDAAVVASHVGSTLRITVTLTAADPAIKTFALTFSVTDGQALIETIT